MFLGDAEKEEGKDVLPSLDSFLAKHTSEDNASFEQIMEVAKEKEKAKHAWLYKAEEEFAQVGKRLDSIQAVVKHLNCGNCRHLLNQARKKYASLFLLAFMFSFTVGVPLTLRYRYVVVFRYKVVTVKEKDSLP